MSLRSDKSLSKDALRYERARVRRRWFEIITSLLLIGISGIVGTMGAERVLSAYALVVFWLVFNESVRRAMRQVGMAENVIESTELARVAPFVSLVQFLVAWIIAAELLIDAGVPAFGRVATGLLSSVMFVIALAATWWPSPTLHDRLALLVWLSLLIPSELASPRSAPAIMTVVRVGVSIGLHMALMSRSEGRVSPSKWRSFDNTAIRHVMSVASNNSARKLAQTAWIVHAWPPLLLGTLVIVALNEWKASRPLPVRQRTSPPPSPLMVGQEEFVVVDEEDDGDETSSYDIEAARPTAVAVSVPPSPDPTSKTPSPQSRGPGVGFLKYVERQKNRQNGRV